MNVTLSKRVDNMPHPPQIRDDPGGVPSPVSQRPRRGPRPTGSADGAGSLPSPSAVLYYADLRICLPLALTNPPASRITFVPEGIHPRRQEKSTLAERVMHSTMTAEEDT